MGQIFSICTKKIKESNIKTPKFRNVFARAPEGDAFLRGEPVQYIDLDGKDYDKII